MLLHQLGQHLVLLRKLRLKLLDLAHFGRGAVSPRLPLEGSEPAVDTLTEARVQRGMEAVMAGRTSFVIAHRLSTIKNADRILVIDGGQIVEMGSHVELIRARGHYYSLYTRQFRREMEDEYDVFKGEAPAMELAPA